MERSSSFIAVFDLIGIRDLCNLITYDIFHKVSPKIVFLERGELFFIPDLSFFLSGGRTLYLMFKTSEGAISKDFLVCNGHGNGEVSFFIYMLKTSNFVEGILRNNVDVDLLVEVSYRIDKKSLCRSIWRSRTWLVLASEKKNRTFIVSKGRIFLCKYNELEDIMENFSSPPILFKNYEIYYI